MSQAFKEIYRTLNLGDDAKSERELIAKKIVTIAQGGERNATLLRERVLKESTQDVFEAGESWFGGVPPTPLPKSAQATSGERDCSEGGVELPPPRKGNLNAWLLPLALELQILRRFSALAVGAAATIDLSQCA